MKIAITILLLILIGFVVIDRHRIFVRDPLATVTRNGVKEPGAQVFINADNDVLIENDNAPMYVELIEHNSPIGPPARLNCIHWIACLTNATPATLAGTIPGAKIESMTSKQVHFRDRNDDGLRQSVVTLH